MRMPSARGSSYDVDLFRRFGRIWLKDSPVAVASLLRWRRGPGETHPAGSFSPLRATLFQLAELPDAQQERARNVKASFVRTSFGAGAYPTDPDNRTTRRARGWRSGRRRSCPSAGTLPSRRPHQSAREVLQARRHEDADLKRERERAGAERVRPAPPCSHTHGASSDESASQSRGSSKNHCARSSADPGSGCGA